MSKCLTLNTIMKYGITIMEMEIVHLLSKFFLVKSKSELSTKILGAKRTFFFNILYYIYYIYNSNLSFLTYCPIRFTSDAQPKLVLIKSNSEMVSTKKL